MKKTNETCFIELISRQIYSHLGKIRSKSISPHPPRRIGRVSYRDKGSLSSASAACVPAFLPALARTTKQRQKVGKTSCGVMRKRTSFKITRAVLHPLITKSAHYLFCRGNQLGLFVFTMSRIKQTISASLWISAALSGHEWHIYFFCWDRAHLILRMFQTTWRAALSGWFPKQISEGHYWGDKLVVHWKYLGNNKATDGFVSRL